MLSERDVTTLWRKLFSGREVSSAVLAEAKTLLGKLSPENPLRVRLGAELQEIQKRRASK